MNTKLIFALLLSGFSASSVHAMNQQPAVNAPLTQTLAGDAQRYSEARDRNSRATIDRGYKSGNLSGGQGPRVSNYQGWARTPVQPTAGANVDGSSTAQ